MAEAQNAKGWCGKIIFPMPNPAEEISRMLPPTGVWADLSDRILIELSGPDARRYLNGQCTNDIQKLAVGQSCHACVLTAKGKMCGDVWVTSLAPERFRLDAHASLAESLPMRLERYLIADDAVLETLDSPPRPRLFHWIPGATEGPDLEPEAEAQAEAFRFHKPGKDYWLSANATAPASLSAAAADELRILSGRPSWGHELNENSIPVEAGLEPVSIRYDKGCYIGQEVISRIKSIGRVNRSLYLLEIPLKAAPEPGTEIFATSAEQVWAVGLVTSSFVRQPEDGAPTVWSLAYLKRTWENAGELRCEEQSVTVHALPFAQFPN